MADGPVRTGTKEITPEIVDSVKAAILTALEESDPNVFFCEFPPKTTIDGRVDLRLVAVRAMEALSGFEDIAGLADIYINEVKALEDV